MMLHFAFTVVLPILPPFEHRMLRERVRSLGRDSLLKVNRYVGISKYTPTCMLTLHTYVARILLRILSRNTQFSNGGEIGSTTL